MAHIFESNHRDTSGTEARFYGTDAGSLLSEQGSVMVKVAREDSRGHTQFVTHMMTKDEAISLMAWLSEVTS